MSFRRCAVWALLAALVGFGCSTSREAGEEARDADAKPADTRPDIALVVVVAVDQLRPDRLSEELPGGFGRLIKEGRAFVDAALDHAFTETCPGHAVILTGRHPARIGIPANGYIDPVSLERYYCVEDRAPDAALVGLRSDSSQAQAQGPSDGRSPRVMRASALGDWMKSRRPGTKVFSVSGKDRAAITMGGLHPDAAYWLARGPAPSWVTSGYYQERLPAWVDAWDPVTILAGLPDDWTYLPEVEQAAAQGLRIDDYPHESPMLSRTQPHPLMRDPDVADQLARARHPADRLYTTPFADRVTLAFAKSLIENEGLGTGEGPDLLAVGLSATDLVGHLYGPESWESQDALARLDRMLGDFLDFLEKRFGKDRVVVALTADHGVLPIPEWIQESGRSQCPVKGGRVDADAITAELELLLDSRFSPGEVHHGVSWFASVGSRMTLNRKLTRGDPALESQVISVSKAFIESNPGIARVWTRDEVLAGEGPEPLATYFLNSWVPETGGDLALQAHEDCLLGGSRVPTSHGSPYAYDRKLPLIFMGPGIEAGKVYGTPASSLDIGPTLADYLGVTAPLGLDGKILKLRERY